MKLSTIAARNIQRNRRRSILSGTAIAVAAMTIVIMFSFLEGIKADMRQNMFRFTTGQVRIRNIEYEENERLNPLAMGVQDSSELVAALSSKDYVRNVAPRITFGTAIYENDTTYRAAGIGAVIDRERDFQNLEELLLSGNLPKDGEREILLSQGLAEDMDVQVGDLITLFAQTRGRGSNGMSFTVSGIAGFPLQAMNQSFFIAPLDQIQRFLRMDDSVTEILITFPDDVSTEEGYERISTILAEENRTEIEARQWQNIGQTFSLLEIADFSYTLMALFFFVLGSTVIINTTIMVIYERIREIGTISAMGMTGSEVIRLFFLESFFIGILGTLGGVLLGAAIASVLAVTGVDFGSAMDNVGFDMSSKMYPVLNLKSTVFVFFYSVLIASLSSLIPSRKASRIEPVEALRTV